MFDAIALKPVPAMMKPAAARASGVRFAVDSKNAFTSLYCCVGSSGMFSGSSGASLAIASLCRTARSIPSGEKSLVVTMACFAP